MRKLTSVMVAAILIASFVIAKAHAYQYVKVSGRKLLTDFDNDGVYTQFQIRGAGYSPTPIGRYPSDWG